MRPEAPEDSPPPTASRSGNAPATRSDHALAPFGVPLTFHSSFPQLALGAIVFSLIASRELDQALRQIGSLAALLVALLVHEYAHAVVARRQGVYVLDVHLSALFGQTRMAAPERWDQELRIAVAGPVANLLLAGPLALFCLGTHRYAQGWLDPIVAFTVANVALGTLNLLPAFPMDGGRILRALCWRRLGPERALGIAVTVGRVLAVGVASLALLAPRDPRALIFVLSGLLILVLGEGERRRAQLRRSRDEEETA